MILDGRFSFLNRRHACGHAILGTAINAATIAPLAKNSISLS